MISKVFRICLQRKGLARLLIRNVNHLHARTISANNRQRNYSECFVENEIVELVPKAVTVKDTLYPESKDDTIRKLKNCQSYEEASKFIHHVRDYDKAQVCQLILALFDHFRFLENRSPSNLSAVVSQLNHFIDDLTIEEAALCFHYLARLGVSPRDPMMEQLCDKIMKEIKSDDNLPLFYLSHFTAVLGLDRNLYSAMLAVETLPTVIRRLEEAQNVDDLNQLTLSLSHISNILSLDHLELYKRKVEEFLDQHLINESKPKETLRILNFLNYPHWSARNGKIIRALLLQLQTNIPTLDTRSLVTINRAFRTQLESAALVPLLVKRAQNLLEEAPDVELLSLAVLNVTPDQRTKIAQMVKKFLSSYQISSTQSGETLQTVFKILRLLKISDLDLCDSFWNKALNEIYGTKEHHIYFRLMRHIQKYMFFNNNLGGTYRHKEFEISMLQMLNVELKKTLSPKDFAMFASFVIAYGDNEKLPNFIMYKIEELHEQFSVKDCLQLSRGFQIMFEVMHRKKHSPDVEHQVDVINFALARCSERHLRNKDLHLSELNSIIKGFINRKAMLHSSLFYDMINRYDQQLNLNSRAIRDIAVNLTSSNFKMDKVCDQFVDYILENHEHVTGDTVEKMLTCCYNFSYFPENFEVFEKSSDIIIRDFNFMSGLSIVNALLALIFFKACPQELIATVFSGDFIKRLQQEIEMCYSKNTYPQRVMKQVMQLNRAVCLDCPEVNVKWFQQSFMEAQALKPARVHSRLFKDVHNTLLSIVQKPEHLLSGRITPYGYRIDFELNLDQYNRFVIPPPDDYSNPTFMPNVNKIAILLLSNRMLCNNDYNRLRGSEILRMRHLEMMGYRVVHIKITDFNSLYRNLTTKIKYLKNLLQLTA